MRAIIRSVNSKTAQTSLGTLGNFVSREYTTFGRLYHYAVLPHLLAGKSVVVEVYNDWSNRYGEPDRRLTFGPIFSKGD